MLTEQDMAVVREALKYGHHKNPKVVDAGGGQWTQDSIIGRHDVLPGPLQEDVRRAIIRSWQEMMSPAIEPLIAAYRPERPMLQIDGKVGPATLASTTMQRCGCQDYLDLAAEGQGSWPMPCQKQTLVHFDFSGCPYRDEIDQIVDMCISGYAKVGWGLKKTNSRSGAHIRVTWEVLRGSVIGLAEFNQQSCRDSVFCKLDPGYRPSQLVDQVARLLFHELGHNGNLPHTNGGIMNPLILSGPFNGWLASDRSMPRLKRFFGGEPLPDDNGDDDNDDGVGAVRITLPHDLPKGKYILMRDLA